MPTLDIPLGPSSDPARSTNVGAAELVNCFVEPVGQGRQRYAIYSDPGLTTLTTFAGRDRIRGQFKVGSAHYVVAGEGLYKVSGGTGTLLGVVLGTAPVITAMNGATIPEVAIVAETKRYMLKADVLTEITDADLPSGVHSGAFLDGYVIFGLPDGRFFIAALDDADNIDALDFAEAESSPDSGVRVFVFNRELWYFGEETTEIFTNTGNSNFPIERLGGGVIARGCLSKYSVAAFDNSVAWVGDNGLVLRAEGYRPVRISNHGVEKDIQRTVAAQKQAEIEAFTYIDGGHEFYVLSGPDWTWVYDAATKLWHRKKSYGSERSKISTYVHIGNRHVVGDVGAGTIYYMDQDVEDEAGEHMVVEITSPPVGDHPFGHIWDSVVLDVELGVGDGGSDAHSSDPKLMLECSKDGGKTFPIKREKSLGALGQYQGLMRFNGLGSCGAQGMVFRVSVSAPVKRAFISGKASVRQLRAA